MIVFQSPADTPLVTRTENISCGGLYFRCASRIEPGEQLQSLVTVATASVSESAEARFLACALRVVRIDRINGSSYGVACEIEKYRVHTNGPAT